MHSILWGSGLLDGLYGFRLNCRDVNILTQARDSAVFGPSKDEVLRFFEDEIEG